MQCTLLFAQKRIFPQKSDHKSVVVTETDGNLCVKLIGMPGNEEMEK